MPQIIAQRSHLNMNYITQYPMRDILRNKRGAILHALPLNNFISLYLAYLLYLLFNQLFILAIMSRYFSSH